MKQRGVIGMLLIILSIVGVFTWEVWARKELTFDQVLVFNQDVAKAAEITEEMIDSKKVAKRTPGAILWKDRKEVVGKVATQVIPKGSEVFTVYLSESYLVIKENQFIVAIPSHIILSIPEKVQRGEKVFLYSTDERDASEYLFSTRVVSAKRDDRGYASTPSASLEVIVSEKEARKIAKTIGDSKKLVVLCR